MKILLINPPIYDFSAYDVWIKPLGLLYISSILREYGCEVVLLDCLDRHIPADISVKSKSDGTGKFYSEIVPKPDVYKNIPLNYRRYGVPKEFVHRFIDNNKDVDFVLLTSVMTYWYLGVCEILETLHEIAPKTRIILGGNLPVLLPEFTRQMFGDKVDFILHSYDLSEMLDFIFPNNSLNNKFRSFENYPAPDYSHYHKLSYIVLRTSYGCFYNCDYCSCGNLLKYTSKKSETIVGEINSLYKRYNAENFVFYDDELLARKKIIKNLFRQIKRLNLPVRFFTPNGLNPKYIDRELAFLMKELNFCDPRLSLETVSDATHNTVDRKVKFKNFEDALNNLISAGYSSRQISTYIMAGLPTEKLDDVYRSVEIVAGYKVRVRLSELSPVPQSRLFSQFNIGENTDPLLHNNSIFLFNGIPGKIKPWCDFSELEELKNFVREVNSSL